MDSLRVQQINFNRILTQLPSRFEEAPLENESVFTATEGRRAFTTQSQPGRWRQLIWTPAIPLCYKRKLKHTNTHISQAAITS